MSNIDSKRRQVQSIEQEMANNNRQWDLLERKIRSYEEAKRLHPQSARGYDNQIYRLKRQADTYRNKRINLSGKLNRLEREISSISSLEEKERVKQSTAGRRSEARVSFRRGSPFERGGEIGPRSTQGPGSIQAPGMGPGVRR